MKCKGVRVMNMKITNKILAGTLALMSAFTSVSAEPLESEKLPAVSQNTKSEKLKHKILKGALTVGAVGATAGLIFGGVFNLVCFLYKRDENKVDDEYEKERVKLCSASDWVIYCYCIPQIRECIENFYETRETESSCAFKYLFDVLDGGEKLDRQRVKNSLKCVFNHTCYYHSHCLDDLGKAIKGVDDNVSGCEVYNHLTDISKEEGWFNGRDDTIRVFVPGNSYRPYFLKNFIKIKCSRNTQITYNLKAAILYNNKGWPFTECYIKHENGWYRHSLDGNCILIEENIVNSELENINHCMYLIYTEEFSTQ